jgi:hypothetical protein
MPVCEEHSMRYLCEPFTVTALENARADLQTETIADIQRLKSEPPPNRERSAMSDKKQMDCYYAQGGLLDEVRKAEAAE